jgi:hypothetical protein
MNGGHFVKWPPFCSYKTLGNVITQFYELQTTHINF